MTPDLNHASPTPLERQQVQVTDPAQVTFWHRVRFELVTRYATSVGAREVLDIGAGSGQLGAWLLETHPGIGYRFEELSPLLDEQLTARFGAERRSSPDTPIPGGTVVALLDVIEHIEDDAAALARIAERMTTGGHLVVTVPALQWAFSSWDTELGHHRRYSKRTLRSVVTAAGLQVERVDYLFPELLPLLPLRKLRRAPREHVDFPQLGPLATRLGYAVSSATAATRRLWPAGTSVVLTAVRTTG